MPHLTARSQEYTIEAYEILRLYCEIILTRFPLLDHAKPGICPSELAEPLSSLACVQNRIVRHLRMLN